MTWILSDGTEVDLGGRVRGDSSLADALKQDVVGRKRGRPTWVLVGPIPGPRVRLQLDDPALVDAWIRQVAVRYDVTVMSGPEIEPIKRPESPEYPPGTVF